MASSYTSAGEFSDSARIRYFKATEAISKGETLVVTPAVTISTVAVSGTADVSANYPCAVATQAIEDGSTGACVVYGEVAVTADGACYDDELVAAKSGKVAPAADSATGLPTGVIGRITEGGIDGAIVTMFLGRVV